MLDELHAYRGIFGAHLHHLLARFERVARAASGGVGRPSYIAASATAAEADQFAAALAGRPFAWIRSSGAPRAARRFLLVRATTSPYRAAVDAFAILVRSGAKTIAFTKARRITELLWTWLERRAPEVAARTKSYRAGFLPGERREIERALFSGALDGVLSTSALELGIDVGGLDACVLVGYPGSAMATWQRAGRVGRGGRESLVVLVALPDALDQYLLDHPREILDRPLERLVVDPENESVAKAHLVCAASELPLSPTADFAYLQRFAPAVGELLGAGELARRAEGDELVSIRRRPQRDVSLRGTGATWAIVERRAAAESDEAAGITIGTIDGARVFAECHPGAIYLHAGRQYVVADLDLERRIATVERSDVDWYTQPRSEKETEILEILSERAEGSLRSGFGRLRVTEQVVGFERRRTYAGDALDVEALDLPPVTYETQGLWFTAPPGSERRFAEQARNLLGALHAAEHAAIGLFPLVALCDRSDLGGISLSQHPQLGGPGVFVYEGHVGGVGIARRGFAELSALLAQVADHLERCPCEDGCPSCVQSPKCGNGNRPLDKAGAIELLRELLVAPAAPATPELLAATPTFPKKAEDSLKDAGSPLFGRGSGGSEVSSSRSAHGSARAGGTKKHARESLVSEASASSSASIPSSASEAALDSSFPSMESLSASSLSLSNASVSSTPRSGRVAERVGTVLFDVETLRSAEEVGGWNHAHRMGVALAVALRLEDGAFETFFERDVGRLVALLKSAALVVGFNSRRFDYSVLSGYTGEQYGRTLPTLDLLESLRGRLGFRVGLDHVARETIGRGKGGDGLQSLAWVKEGRFDLIEEYCRQDVELLRDVYLHGRREGYVVVSTKSSGRIRVTVDW